jgi:hypothetical protein
MQKLTAMELAAHLCQSPIQRNSIAVGILDAEWRPRAPMPHSRPGLASAVQIFDTDIAGFTQEILSANSYSFALPSVLLRGPSSRDTIGAVRRGGSAVEW